VFTDTFFNKTQKFEGFVEIKVEELNVVIVGTEGFSKSVLYFIVDRMFTVFVPVLQLIV